MKLVTETKARLLRAALGVGVRTKIMGIALGLTLLLGLGVSLLLQRAFVGVLREGLEEVGIDVAENAVSDGAEPLLTRNAFALQRVAESLYRSHRDVRYVVFRDSAGHVLAHTFAGTLPPDLQKSRDLPAGRPLRVEVLDSDEGPIHDIALRAPENGAGSVQVGVTENWLRQRVRKMTCQLVAATLAMSLLGIGAAYVLTAVLTNPIRELTEVARAASEANFDRRAQVFAEDEIGELSRAFNFMCERLGRSREEIRRKERLRLQLLQKVITAQEDERKRVARELHDHTGQQLTTLAVELRALGNAATLAEAKERVQHLRGVVAQTLSAVRGLAFELRPSILDDLGLAAAVERHVEDYQRKLGVPVDFEAVGPWSNPLPAEVETTLYRICQEALTNAARHAEPTHLSVLLTRRRDSAVAIVEDEGKGFDVDAALSDHDEQRHLGLFGMRERAGLVGGKLTIESRLGRGTTVFVEIPCGASTGEEKT
jgi:signal transduction histidine kinase